MAAAAAGNEGQVEVKGTREMMLQAEAGMKLFKEAKELEGDRAAAEAWKSAEDVRIKGVEAEAEALTGAENKKARQAKSKEAAALKKSDQYIDAELVLKGKAPKHGFFVLAGQEILVAETKGAEASGGYNAITPDAKAEAKPASKKDDAKKAGKKQESAGISKAERDELEKLKNDIIARKAELKAGGMSGGQINKDEQVVGWVARMNELKEKESPGSTATAKKDSKKEAKLSGEAQAELEKLSAEIEEYRQRLVSEFQYSKKDIAADPDMVDMQARLKKLQGKK
eukprot:TRINITY_DN1218_c0_g1_i1.p1 TRINITY_DN1218_c0_g1~~TRINITY_DN1218_c0_g1_i1.p1  ORF type:complete len:284 (-),score=138.41 TRINITY_DN1218_c0_g1_i1:311-1162(-)